MKMIRPFKVTDAALLASNVSEAAPPAWSAATLYALGNTITDPIGHRIYESLSGGTSNVVTITIASPGVVSWVAHGLAAGTPVTFTTTGALPTGLVVGTIYYVLSPAADTFQLAATVGGAAIATTGAQSGVHTAIANPNLGKDPTLAANIGFWLDAAPTNRWAMFDTLNGTATTDPAMIDVTVQTTGRIDSAALLNLVGASVQIISTDDIDGVIYNETFSLISTDGIGSWFDYFFEEIRMKTDLVVTDLPLYTDQQVQVIVDGAGTPVACGVCVFGFARVLGGVSWGAGLGIADYSRKEKDDFGNFTIVERAFAKTGSFTVYVASGLTDETQRVLASYRATPVVWLGSDRFNSTLIFGFFRSFNIELANSVYSVCSLEIEGLT